MLKIFRQAQFIITMRIMLSAVTMTKKNLSQGYRQRYVCKQIVTVVLAVVLLYDYFNIRKETRDLNFD